MSPADRLREWRKANPEKVRAASERQRRKMGQQPRERMNPEVARALKNQRERRRKEQLRQAGQSYWLQKKSTQVDDSFTCNICGDGPCRGKCDGN